MTPEDQGVNCTLEIFVRRGGGPLVPIETDEDLRGLYSFIGWALKTRSQQINPRAVTYKALVYAIQAGRAFNEAGLQRFRLEQLAQKMIALGWHTRAKSRDSLRTNLYQAINGVPAFVHQGRGWWSFVEPEEGGEG